LKVVFICVGAVKKGCIKKGFSGYLKRIRRYLPVEVIDVREENSSIKMPVEVILRREAERIARKTAAGDFTVALSERGRSFSSGEFSQFVERIVSGGKKRLCFIAGGAFGLHPSVIDGADAVLSLSPMTLPHDLARLVLAEQVYRAFTIMRGEPYSH